ncbi:MATE family efflux transporter [Oscillibacter sp.]|uniref:MATE family efflux transporter n=1 Tax=Oscillibacter sp. TaxID=1945593 RepID=UPI0028AC7773|nr:MATE family efflux transporter [Oscillibacter sp.]
MQRDHDFSQGSIAKNITVMAVPMIIAQVMNVLYNITDRFFIGRIGGGESLSLTGVGIVFPIITIITAFTNLFGMGGAPLCSIARGRKDEVLAEQIIGSSFFMLVITALILTFIGVVFQNPLLRLFGASSEVFPYAKDYFSVYIWGTAASVIGLGMNNFINCQGFGKVGMVSIAAGAVINVILDPLLIFVLDLGVRGAAIATVVAQLVSAVWVLHFLTGRKALLLLRKEHIRWQPAVLLQTVQVGFANFVMAFTNGITQFVYNRALMNLGGDVFVGAMTVITSVREMVIMPVHGITAGSQPVLGYNYGAQKLDRVKKGIAFTTGVCIVYTAVAWAVLFLFPQAAILLFTDDPKLLEVGVDMLHVYFGGFCLMALQFSGQATFTALGKAKYAIFFSLFRKVVLVIPLIWLLPRYMGVSGVFWSEPISNLIGGGACFATMLWMVKKKL